MSNKSLHIKFTDEFTGEGHIGIRQRPRYFCQNSPCLRWNLSKLIICAYFLKGKTLKLFKSLLWVFRISSLCFTFSLLFFNFQKLMKLIKSPNPIKVPHSMWGGSVIHLHKLQALKKLGEALQKSLLKKIESNKIQSALPMFAYQSTLFG